jgi:ABC-type glycerol-3-phosphate transport system permease component
MVKSKVERTAKNFILYFIYIIGSIALLIPLFWMVSTSLKTPAQIFKYPIIWIPHPIVWRNYPDAFLAIPFLRYIGNTVFIAFTSIIGDLLSCSLVAYSFARLRYPGRDFFFMLMLSTLMIPGSVTMIPQFLLYKWFHLIDTYVPLILPAYLAYPMWVFLMRQFFMTVPFEYDDAAKIDGCGYLATYWKILMPQIKPALIAVAIFSFMAHWNNFMGPLIYLNSQEKYPLALGLRLFQGLYMTKWELVMAASTMALIPPLVIFFIAQRYFIQGIVITGLKG